MSSLVEGDKQQSNTHIEYCHLFAHNFCLFFINTTAYNLGPHFLQLKSSILTLFSTGKCWQNIAFDWIWTTDLWIPKKVMKPPRISTPPLFILFTFRLVFERVRWRIKLLEDLARAKFFGVPAPAHIQGEGRRWKERFEWMAHHHIQRKIGWRNFFV